MFPVAQSKILCAMHFLNLINGIFSAMCNLFVKNRKIYTQFHRCMMGPILFDISFINKSETDSKFNVTNKHNSCHQHV